MNKHYHILGTLPEDTVSLFKEELLRIKEPNVPFQWIWLNQYLNNKFLEIFENTELKIQLNSKDSPVRHPIQKACFSKPGHGWRIHKDGVRCRSALNIALSSNASDWIRWYDEELINSRSELNILRYKDRISRNIDIMNYEEIPCVDELRVGVGDVYVLDVDTYHSFKCNGPSDRLIIQTKFDGFPNFDTLRESLIKKSFLNIKKA
jgi:hypothetical protein